MTVAPPGELLQKNPGIPSSAQPNLQEHFRVHAVSLSRHVYVYCQFDLRILFIIVLPEVVPRQESGYPSESRRCCRSSSHLCIQLRQLGSRPHTRRNGSLEFTVIERSVTYLVEKEMEVSTWRHKPEFKTEGSDAVDRPLFRTGDTRISKKKLKEKLRTASNSILNFTNFTKFKYYSKI